PVGSVLKGIEQCVVRRKIAQQRHHRAVAMRLPLREDEFIVARANAFHVSQAQIDDLHGMAARLSEVDAEINIPPRPGDGWVTEPARIGVWLLFLRKIHYPVMWRLNVEIRGHFRDGAICIESVI